MHFIQKTFIGATDFYYHYHDYHKEMRELAEALENAYNQLISILAESPADAILWSANVDDMITYPPYFEKEILPWCRKASQTLRPRGILLIIHPDGENRGLMDLIPECGMDIADAVTPSPMTKVTIEEYYDRWCRSDKLTIHGGIPEIMLLEESTSWQDLEAYMDHMFTVISPGKRLVASIGDTSPPNTEFERLVYIGQRFEKEGRLPLEAGAARPVSESQLQQAAERVTPETELVADYKTIHKDVLGGDREKIKVDVQQMLDRGFKPQEILNDGMLSAMETVGEKFKNEVIFIPEVLLSARAMEEGLRVLEPYLAFLDKESSGKIMIGTVRGDLHDIGKNLVLTMLKGVGFDTVDLGVNVKVDDFVHGIVEQKPDILGVSALLTTTMPQMRDVIETLTEAGLRESVKIIIGGAPVTQKYCDDIKADGYARDAGDAVSLVKELMKARISKT
jgi:5-methyltetrahydrofolate--homocysteine methyltransferase